MADFQQYLFWAYESDDGNTYQLKLSNEHASCGLLGLAPLNALRYPQLWRPRFILVTNQDNSAQMKVVVNKSNPLWTGQSILCAAYTGLMESSGLFTIVRRTPEYRPLATIANPLF
jgi:hypothetical protein